MRQGHVGQPADRRGGLTCMPSASRLAAASRGGRGCWARLGAIAVGGRWAEVGSIEFQRTRARARSHPSGQAHQRGQASVHAVPRT
jgi:hypothetical protein